MVAIAVASPMIKKRRRSSISASAPAGMAGRGGFGMTALTANDIVLAPIRSGRLGANVGYLKFTPQPTMNPFCQGGLSSRARLTFKGSALSRAALV